MGVGASTCVAAVFLLFVRQQRGYVGLCVRACVRACVCVCVRACVRACVCVLVSVYSDLF